MSWTLATEDDGVILTFTDPVPLDELPVAVAASQELVRETNARWRISDMTAVSSLHLSLDDVHALARAAVRDPLNRGRGRVAIVAPTRVFGARAQDYVDMVEIWMNAGLDFAIFETMAEGRAWVREHAPPERNVE